jgi:hypothetical protein
MIFDSSILTDKNDYIEITVPVEWILKPVYNRKNGN